MTVNTLFLNAHYNMYIFGKRVVSIAKSSITCFVNCTSVQFVPFDLKFSFFVFSIRIAQALREATLLC